MLDPDGSDRDEFVVWMVSPAMDSTLTDSQLEQLRSATAEYPAAAFSSVRSELLAKKLMKTAPLEFDEVLALTDDHLSPAIMETRRFQTLQALVNCTRRSLLPHPDITEEERAGWQSELDELARRGIS